MRTIFFDWTTGQTIYAKLSPLDDVTWTNGIVLFGEIGTTGQYAADVPLGHHVIFLQAGGSPADTDIKIGYEPELVIPAKILGF